jgi:hypothetical protein
VRTAGQLQAFHALLAALSGSGNEELARELAEFAFNEPWTRTIDWMTLAFGAGELATMGRHEEALQWFSRIKDSPRLPWDPVLRDVPAFQAYADEPVYVETLQAIEERRAALRARLPATLAEFGVSL